MCSPARLGRGAESGRVPVAWAKLGTAKAFLSGGGLELKLVSFFLPKHLLSCTLPFPPFPPGFQAIEMFYLIPPPQNSLWFDCLWLDFPPRVALR